MRRARFVKIDPARVEAWARQHAAAPPPPATYDARFHHAGTPASTLAFVLTLNTVNFGSGWFPYLRKEPARSGYLTVAGRLKHRFDNDGPWRAAELAEISEREMAQVLDQDLAVPEVAELMRLYAQALRELGELLIARYGGRFEGPVEEAAGSAERLVTSLARMTYFRDVERYEELEVPFYKRAQITASDLALAFRGHGPGHFGDLDALTIFADNLVPHVLRCDGVLVYDAGLARRIEVQETLAAGSLEEIEIRAGGLHAVELLVAELRRCGTRTTARELDQLLWWKGQRPEIKAHPRHRTRTVFY